jgi:SRP-independent targeting protein 2/TMEM208
LEPKMMAITNNQHLAAQNESSVKLIRLGMIIPTVLSFFLRLLFRRDSLPPSKASLAIYIVIFIPMFLLSNYLVKIGTARREPSTGTLISPGEDLSQPGVTEWCFDILYITCATHLSDAFHPLDLSFTRGVPNRQWSIWRMVLGTVYGRQYC